MISDINGTIDDLYSFLLERIRRLFLCGICSSWEFKDLEFLRQHHKEVHNINMEDEMMEQEEMDGNVRDPDFVLKCDADDDEVDEQQEENPFVSISIASLRKKKVEYKLAQRMKSSLRTFPL